MVTDFTRDSRITIHYTHLFPIALTKHLWLDNAYRKKKDLFNLTGCFLIFEKGSHCVAQAGLKLKILLPLPPESWDYR
jgi:hypothetical protein